MKVKYVYFKYLQSRTPGLILIVLPSDGLSTQYLVMLPDCSLPKTAGKDIVHSLFKMRLQELQHAILEGIHICSLVGHLDTLYLASLMEKRVRREP